MECPTYWAGIMRKLLNRAGIISNNHCPRAGIITNNACPRAVIITNNACPRAVIITNNACPRAGIMACPKFDQEIFLRHQCIVYNTRNTFNSTFGGSHNACPMTDFNNFITLEI